MAEIEPRILILDDDSIITDLLSDILSEEGYKVMACNSPKDVLYLAHQFVPDLLLLDIMMPELDGFDVCEFFKRDPELKYARIVVLTARDNKDTRIKCYKTGADTFLSKPFEIDELREVIKSNISSKLTLDRMIGDLREQTLLDRTTTAFNTKHMKQRLASELERVDRYHRTFSLLLLNLESFTQINVRYGYAFGNEVLKNIVEAVRLELREPDLLGRYSEDSFLMMLPETPVAGAKTLADRIHDLVSSMVFLKKKRLVLRASVAVVEVDTKMKIEDALKKLEEELSKVRTRKAGKHE